MKKYVAKADPFLVTDKSFFANILKDILNRAFQFVVLGHISAGKVEDVCVKKDTPTFIFFFPKRVFVREWQGNNPNWLF